MKIGDKFYRLEFVEDLGMIEYGKKGSKHRMGIFLCDCGEFTKVQCGQVKSGHTKSCGCYSKEVATISNTIHGLYNHPIYTSWRSMKQRCYNKKYKKYIDHGGRGIKVCEDWHDFVEFYNWSIENGWEKGLQIDRIDNDGNYEPNNCQWVTSAENNSIGKKRMMSNNTSGYVGIMITKCGTWSSYINGKYIGSFKTIGSAVESRIAKEIELFGEQKTNFHYNKNK